MMIKIIYFELINYYYNNLFVNDFKVKKIKKQIIMKYF